MLKVEWTNRDALDCGNITCANCQYNDGMVYTSMPPQYKCTITNEFHHNNDKCNVEFAPIKHGHWIEEPIEDEWGKLPSIWHCSECDNLELNNSPYCPNCGAKMDEVKND